MKNIISITGAELKNLRLSLGLTQTQAARIVSYTRSQWQKWESDVHAMPEAVFELFCIKTKS